jgi:hypothetical protein
MLRSPRQKKQKMAKDAPIFQRGKTRGEVRYPPDEHRDGDLATLHREFRIHPFGNIADYPRHIPYNSDKKSFQELTGRESFEGKLEHGYDTAYADLQSSNIPFSSREKIDSG